jgi:CheY-like chemotaxis protein
MSHSAIIPIILVVDDDQAIAMLTQRLLTRSFPDFEVRSTTSAAESLTIIAQEADRVRLLLTDLSLPGMDGAQLVAAVKAEWPRIRLVVMSGRITDWQTSVGPIDGTLPKPSSREQLEQVVRAALARN